MEFVFVSGRPALDFVGTRKWRRRPDAEEQLAAPADLARWIVAAGLLDRRPRVDRSQLAPAIELREALYRLLDARRRDRRPRPADVRTVNAVVANPPLRRRIGGSGAVRTEGGLAEVLSAVAGDALALLADADAIGRLRECANADCTRLFVDTSRAGARRWCGMAECGNRAKVASFRRRHTPA